MTLCPWEHFSVWTSFCLALSNICSWPVVCVRVTRKSRSVTLQSHDPSVRHAPHSATRFSGPLAPEVVQYMLWSGMRPSQVMICCFVVSFSLLSVHDGSVYAAGNKDADHETYYSPQYHYERRTNRFQTDESSRGTGTLRPEQWTIWGRRNTSMTDWSNQTSGR